MSSGSMPYGESSAVMAAEVGHVGVDSTGRQVPVGFRSGDVLFYILGWGCPENTSDLII